MNSDESSESGSSRRASDEAENEKGSQNTPESVESEESSVSQDPFEDMKIHFLTVFDKIGSQLMFGELSLKYTSKDLDLVALRKTVLELKTTSDDVEYFKSTNSERDEWNTMYIHDCFYVSGLFQKGVSIRDKMNLFSVVLN